MRPLVLTLAGLDPTSGAGIQSDVLTLYQLGVYPLSIPTSVTGQNAKGVFYRKDLEVSDVLSPLEILFSTHHPHAIKIGMVGSLKQLEAIFDFLSHLDNPPPIVLDPVMYASSGKALMDADAMVYLRDVFLKIVTVVTPNLHEFSALFCYDFSFESPVFPETSCEAVLVKGGHAKDHANDCLMDKNGGVRVFKERRIHAPFTHGTGCTLSSAIAAYMAKGESLEDSVLYAKKYLLEGIKNPILFENGYGAIRK